MKQLLPLRKHTLSTLIDLIAWVQTKNHRAYLSHRRKRLVSLLVNN